MNINTQIQSSITGDTAYHSTDINKDFKVDNRIKLEVSEKQTPSGNSQPLQKVLTNGELTALHMLFGTEKPKEFNFYGHRPQPVHRGQLLDLVG